MSGSFQDLKVYKLAYQMAMEIFEVLKTFPKEEIYSLTDQIRRSSRSVCANIAKGIVNESIPNIFLLKFQLTTENVAKHWYGLNLHTIVATFLKTHITHGTKHVLKSGKCLEIW